jgi:hypothetical protein
MSKAKENVMQIKQVISQNRCITICDLANEVGISFGSSQSILAQDLSKQWIATKIHASSTE